MLLLTKLEISKKQLIFALVLVASVLVFYVGLQFTKSAPTIAANYLWKFPDIQIVNETFGANPTTFSAAEEGSKNDTNQTWTEATDQKNSTNSTTDSLQTKTQKQLSQCPAMPGDLVGRVSFKNNVPTLETLLMKYPYVENGGRIRPSDCVARQRNFNCNQLTGLYKRHYTPEVHDGLHPLTSLPLCYEPDSIVEFWVAIIFPFRNRLSHLYILLNNLIPILHKQLMDVTFVLVEQEYPTTFNRAALFNIGFLESLKLDKFDCFIFHDVDMVPINDKNIYRCSETPKHFIAGLNTNKYKLPYYEYFGGVVAMTKEQYLLINGHSNLYFGWGGEDDDLLYRCKEKGYKLVRNPVTMGLYNSLVHTRDKGNEPNPERFHLLNQASSRQKVDGLNTVKYTVTGIHLKTLYTEIKIRINVKELLEISCAWSTTGVAACQKYFMRGPE